MEQSSGMVKSKKEDFFHIEEMIRLNKLSEAEKSLESLLKSNDPWIYYYWGCLQMRLANYGDAKDAFVYCLDIDPLNDVAWYNLGTIFMKWEYKDKAKECFDKVITLTPDAIVPRLDKAIVMVGLPHYGKIPMEFMLSYLDMTLNIKSSDNVEIMMTNCCGSRISSNRNNLAMLAKRKGATHIMFIDTDMIFPSDGLQRLLSHQKDIVCATTCKRGDEDGNPIGSAIPQEGNNTGKAQVKAGLIEMSLVGSCFMLIKMDVFEKIGMAGHLDRFLGKKSIPPYYEPPNYDAGDAFGEDITFCKLAREAGYRIWVDYQLSIELGHLGDKVYQIKPAKPEQIA